MTTVAVLLGVDIVERGRLRRMLSDLGDVYLRQVATPSERKLHTGAADAAPDFAVKECLIKAVGGRPDGFSWHDFERASAVGSVPPPAPAVPAQAEEIDDEVTALLDEAAAGLGAATGFALTTTDTYAVRGASRTAALARLAPGQGGLSVTGAARWGLDESVLVALAVVTTSAKTMTKKGAPGCP
ncbi:MULTISPECIES: 4'-phosphopantetheinyl transferase superfamily protein [Actinoalloteichus]|uniref:4'-phosphopantetheinyl transferase superfamily protein n=1 Tax=Actinoalloteichus fjordicus TaxID=1612552 RepID=A0AAC9LAA0_9PSEU|nr:MULTISPECIES: 4'-phosphopantetheinyl transferase superfamily protein [Actinoalloteichus]APU13230.1 4'-phosphopantetheinyl transferase superfamily protein [Actinoalloteichus fjordicus]APU19181.1 4'-phosphopantetheinyl transferase superfamily protein [Actinoalloteichus sp. GBA129-24]